MTGQYYKIKYGSMDQFFLMVDAAVNDWYSNLVELSEG